MFNGLPTMDEVGVKVIPDFANGKYQLLGGETTALQQMVLRLKLEEHAFIKGFYRPLQARPDLLGPQLSMSAALALGAISVRL